MCNRLRSYFRWYNSLKQCSHRARHQTTAPDAFMHDVGRHRRHRTMSSVLIVRCHPMSFGNFYMQVAVPCGCCTMSHDIVRHRATIDAEIELAVSAAVLLRYVNQCVQLQWHQTTPMSSDVVRSVNTAWDDYDLLTIMTLYRAAIQCPQWWHTTLPGLHFTAPVHCRDCTQTTVWRISLSSLFT